MVHCQRESRPRFLPPFSTRPRASTPLSRHHIPHMRGRVPGRQEARANPRLSSASRRCVRGTSRSPSCWVTTCSTASSMASTVSAGLRSAERWKADLAGTCSGSSVESRTIPLSLRIWAATRAEAEQPAPTTPTTGGPSGGSVAISRAPSAPPSVEQPSSHRAICKRCPRSIPSACSAGRTSPRDVDLRRAEYSTPRRTGWPGSITAHP